MNQISKLLDGSAVGQFCKVCSEKLLFPLPHGLMFYSPRIYRQVGILRGKKPSWRCCKNSLELIRQSMHIFTNIFSGEGGEKYII